ncbi:DegV family protein [Halalkalibacter hemicellulosilyticus]|uniref:DegV family protein n=1 Tax=Halalkalibacter hemicellulosilyticusJCM 9152 TaxID=1236971 RepID=W4QKX3_9BACI|nr:DegV family protein [Halalkalibacter hemicellulosilyticus]GAE32775.1 DegV family protein [Halalkalibacter hemicellulosilyticusJCM 9152]
MEKKVAIVTDSTAYLSPEIRKQLEIEMVPLSVVFGEEAFREELDLSTNDFYEKIATSEQLPTTSQPAVGDFVTLFERLKSEGYEQVISIHLSSKISGTFQTSQTAASMVNGIEVLGFDSEISCAPQAYYVLEAAKLANEGTDGTTIIDYLQSLKKTCRAYFMVDNLNHLHRGGRLNAAQLVVGNLLKIKPILHFENGRIVPFEKVRTEKKALARILQLLAEDASKGSPLDVTVIHANREDGAEELADTIREAHPSATVSISYFGPVIGTHLGAGSLGVTWNKYN